MPMDQPSAEEASQSAEACLPAAPAPVRPPPPHVFGSVALPIRATRLDSQWLAARSPLLEDIEGPWRGLSRHAGMMRGLDRLTFVNSWINRHIRYRDDPDGDRWSAAVETLQSGEGDCEDFAVAKMSLLIEAGEAPENLYLVVVRDTARNIDHAVLAVNMDGEMLVLDSRTDRIMPSSAIADYHPVFSYGGSFAWMHGFVSAARFRAGR